MFLGILPFRDGNLICEVKRMSETVQRKVEKALDEIRPNIQADGGDVQLVAVEKGIVKVRLQGHCVGCPSRL
jgi:Fe-S cluster biogenesis protein NfuA